MSIIESAVRLFAPYTCIGCGVEEDLMLCDDCLLGLSPVSSRCYKCGVATEDYAVCWECQASSSLNAVRVCVQYRELARQIVHRMKYERAKAATREIAHVMAGPANHLPAGVLLVPIPTATSRVRMRGYDHAALLAKELAIATHQSYAPLLRRLGQAHQVGASRSERLRQLESVFRPVRPGAIQGKRIMLVDDVLTTGATLESAARVLKHCGAKQVHAIVFAQA